MIRVHKCGLVDQLCSYLGHLDKGWLIQSFQVQTHFMMLTTTSRDLTTRYHVPSTALWRILPQEQPPQVSEGGVAVLYICTPTKPSRCENLSQDLTSSGSSLLGSDSESRQCVAASDFRNAWRAHTMAESRCYTCSRIHRTLEALACWLY